MSPVLTKNKIKLASKNGPTKFSDFIEESYIKKNSNIKFMEFFEEWMSKSYTCIFEWVSPEDPIVLTYEKDSLTLIALRDNITGTEIAPNYLNELGDYIRYQDMLESANKFNIPVVKVWNSGQQIENMQDFLNKIKDAKGIEGGL